MGQTRHRRNRKGGRSRRHRRAQTGGVLENEEPTVLSNLANAESRLAAEIVAEEAKENEIKNRFLRPLNVTGSVPVASSKLSNKRIALQGELATLSEILARNPVAVRIVSQYFPEHIPGEGKDSKKYFDDFTLKHIIELDKIKRDPFGHYKKKNAAVTLHNNDVDPHVDLCYLSTHPKLVHSRIVDIWKKEGQSAKYVKYHTPFKRDEPFKSFCGPTLHRPRITMPWVQPNHLIAILRHFNISLQFEVLPYYDIKPAQNEIWVSKVADNLESLLAEDRRGGFIPWPQLNPATDDGDLTTYRSTINKDTIANAITNNLDQMITAYTTQLNTEGYKTGGGAHPNTIIKEDNLPSKQSSVVIQPIEESGFNSAGKPIIKTTTNENFVKLGDRSAEKGLKSITGNGDKTYVSKMVNSPAQLNLLGLSAFVTPKGEKLTGQMIFPSTIISKDGYIMDGHHGWAKAKFYQALVDRAIMAYERGLTAAGTPGRPFGTVYPERILTGRNLTGPNKGRLNDGGTVHLYVTRVNLDAVELLELLTPLETKKFKTS